LNVSESGYYRWKKNCGKPRRDDILLVAINSILEEHPDNENYGVQRIHLALLQHDLMISKRTVYRVMKKHGLIRKPVRHPNGITREDREAQKSENLIQRDFSADKPCEKLLTDITEVQCADGKLYVSPIMDCFNGEMISLSIADNMRKELCIEALEHAVKGRNLRGAILHSDRGSQYLE
jgi:transposase InsO family protein